MATVIVKGMRSVNKGSLLASCNIEINGVLAIYGVKLLEGSKGRWIGMPSRQGTDKKYYDHVKILKDTLKDDILAAVEKAYGESGGAGSGGGDSESEFG